MNYLNGGYAMLKHNATQTELANAYKTKKPILLYDENGFAYWAKINETTSIVDDETIYTYDVVKINQIENLIDNAGNLRFVEGDGTPMTLEGFTSSYCKWSLSGTHLMLVLSGSFADTTVLPADKIIGEFNLPQYIKDKIFPVWGPNMETRSVTCTALSWSTQTMNVVLYKETATGIMKIKTLSSALTFTDTRHFRIQFDLLIDNDYSE